LAEQPEDAPVPAPGPRAGAGRGWLRQRWLQALLVVVALVVLWGVLLRFAAPGLLRDTISEKLAELTDRPVSIERIEIEPYALVFRMHGLAIGEQHDGSDGQAARSHARLGLLEADLSWRSLRHLAPVLERLVLMQPQVFVARKADGSYDGADIVGRLAASPAEPPEADAGPTRFSIANIVLAEGRFGLDDRQRDVRHEIGDIGLRVPFISSLPVDQQIEVEPGFEATIDGAPLQASGRMLPFETEPTGELQFALAGFDLTRLLPYLPEPLPARLLSATLTTDLVVGFRAPDSAPAAVTVRGRGTLAGVEIQQPDGRPLLGLPSVQADDIDFDLLASRLAIGRLTIGEPMVAVERRRGEARFLEPVLAVLERQGGDKESEAKGAGEKGAAEGDAEENPAGEKGAEAAGAAAQTGFAWSIGTLVVERGQLAFDDQDFAPKPLKLALQPVDIEVAGLGLPQVEPAQLKLSARAGGGETLAASAALGLAPFSVDGEAELGEVKLADWAWLAGPALALTVRDGRLAVATRYRVGAAAGTKADAAGWQLTDGRAQLSSLVLRDRSREVARVDRLELSGLAVDPDAQRVSLATARLDGAKLALQRDAQGQIDAAGWWREPGKADGKPAPAGRQPQGKTDTRAWQASVDKLSAHGIGVELRHAATSGARPEALQLGGIRIEASSLATDGRKPAPVSLAAQVGKQGRLSARGTVVPTTGALALGVQASGLPVVAAQPWLPPEVQVELVSGALSAEGKLNLAFGTGGSQGDALSGGWQGALAVDELNARLKSEAAAAVPAAMVRTGSDPADLLKWKSLRLSATELRLAPLFVDLGDVEIDGLRSRLVIQPNGRFNLQDVLANGKAADADAEAAAADTGAAATAGPVGSETERADGVADAAAAAQATGHDPSTAAAGQDPAADAPPLRVGRLRMADGNIDFSDYFIRPNYSANLTGLTGTVGEMRAGQPADLALAGRIDNTGSVKIAGRIDPIGSSLFLDLRAEAGDIDLPALSPYSGKYVGYGIEKGKLSASVEYRVEQGKLTAQNKIVLDQLTFGEPVDSPDALNLPVQFAVSLLKDRNGVIDVQLPISGSLDDPEFSVAGIVLRIIGNLIVRAVTAPFSLIAGLVGGAGEELSTLDFAPAAIELDGTARERLGTLAKALAERPGLKLDIAGHALEADRRTLQQQLLDERLKRIRREMGAGDDKQPITAAQRPALVAQAWLMGRSPVPPEKDRPAPAKMEEELVEAVALPESALRELATRRAQAAKDWLASEGGIDPGRLFVVAGKSAAADAVAAEGQASGGAVVAAGPEGDPVQAGAPATPSGAARPAGVQMVLK
jgi:uncharacterized protein involved in outer membrane biogenesis